MSGVAGVGGGLALPLPAGICGADREARLRPGQGTLLDSVLGLPCGTPQTHLPGLGRSLAVVLLKWARHHHSLPSTDTFITD